jgi:hypothetical protein
MPTIALCLQKESNAVDLQDLSRYHEGRGRGTSASPCTKPEQYGVRNAEWERYHHCRQAREQQHGQKAEGGK